MPLKILFENATLLVVDKPAGFTVQEIGIQLKSQFPELEKLGVENRYGIVHRLDKDTSGILLVARTLNAFTKAQNRFANREVQKQYICLVEGALKQDSGTIHTLLARSPADRRKQKTFELAQAKEGRREAITEWKVLRRFKGYTLLEARPKTGRKHQIRVHMASLGYPIAADKLYGFKNQHILQGLQRQFLHASSLQIEGQVFTSPLPEDLQHILQTLQPYDD